MRNIAVYSLECKLYFISFRSNTEKIVNFLSLSSEQTIFFKYSPFPLQNMSVFIIIIIKKQTKIHEYQFFENTLFNITSYLRPLIIKQYEVFVYKYFSSFVCHLCIFITCWSALFMLALSQRSFMK